MSVDELRTETLPGSDCGLTPSSCCTPAPRVLAPTSDVLTTVVVTAAGLESGRGSDTGVVGSPVTSLREDSSFPAVVVFQFPAVRETLVSMSLILCSDSRRRGSDFTRSPNSRRSHPLITSASRCLASGVSAGAVCGCRKSGHIHLDSEIRYES